MLMDWHTAYPSWCKQFYPSYYALQQGHWGDGHPQITGRDNPLSKPEISGILISGIL